MQTGKRNPLGKINFPGFQEILDFTATGSESSVSVAVNGDTDKEYQVIIRNLVSGWIRVGFNNDSGNNYGFQYLDNSSGSVSAARGVPHTCVTQALGNGILTATLLTPSGLIKTSFGQMASFTSGTTIPQVNLWAGVWNNTANVTLLKFYPDSGNITPGTRIVVYARRSQS